MEKLLVVKSPIDYGLKNFDELETSTATVMVYSNLVFDLEALFSKLRLTNIEVPLTKKQKRVDKKRLTAPYGAIIAVQSKSEIRGVNVRKRKKQWCTICQPVKIVDEKTVKIYTITEVIEKKTGDIDSIFYYCHKCDKKYHPNELKKINHFLNQLTIELSIGKQPLLNIMMFKDNFKIAGCKDIDDAVEAILILWQEYFIHLPDTWRFKKGAAEQPRFVFDLTMRNVDFKLGFPIEKSALNVLMNEERYRENVWICVYESTSHTNLNIKMHSVRPPDFRYDCLVVPLKADPFFVYLDTNPYAKKQRSKPGYVTFIVFSSSEIIVSGKYFSNMKGMYEFFVDTVFKNRPKIEEKLKKVDLTKIVDITNTKKDF